MRESRADITEAGPAGLSTDRAIPGHDRESNGPRAIPAGNYWNNREVRERFESAQGNEVSFDVVSKPIVSGELFKMLGRSPEMTVAFRGDGYMWSFKGSDVINGAYIPDSFDTTISTVSPNLSQLQQAAGDRRFQCAYFSHHGPLPFRAEITVAVEGNGPYDIDYFNPDTEAFEPVSRQVPVQAGSITWEIAHCSDYVLFPLSPADSILPAAAVQEKPPVQATPESGAPRNYYWGAAGIAVILWVGAVFLRRKRNRPTAV